jgi:hypothetical protein
MEQKDNNFIRLEFHSHVNNSQLMVLYLNKINGRKVHQIVTLEQIVSNKNQILINNFSRISYTVKGWQKASTSKTPIMSSC